MSEYGLRDGECIWVDRLDTSGPLTFDAHSHLKAQLLWAARGQIAASVGDRRWILAPTQALWIPAGEVHDVRTIDGTELYCAYLWEEECDPDPSAGGGLTVLSVGPLARELLRHLAREDLADAAARHARATLLSVLTPANAADVELPMPVDPRALSVATAVLDHPGATHSLDDWAGRLHASGRTIQRAFLAETGMTFSAWRTRVRLYRSLPLLAEQVPVAAVATRMGYSSTNGFTGAFRHHFGTTPAHYFAER